MTCEATGRVAGRFVEGELPSLGFAAARLLLTVNTGIYINMRQTWGPYDLA